MKKISHRNYKSNFLKVSYNIVLNYLFITTIGDNNVQHFSEDVILNNK